MGRRSRWQGARVECDPSLSHAPSHAHGIGPVAQRRIVGQGRSGDTRDWTHGVALLAHGPHMPSSSRVGHGRTEGKGLPDSHIREPHNGTTGTTRTGLAATNACRGARKWTTTPTQAKTPVSSHRSNGRDRRLRRVISWAFMLSTARSPTQPQSGDPVSFSTGPSRFPRYSETTYTQRGPTARRDGASAPRRGHSATTLKGMALRACVCEGNRWRERERRRPSSSG